MHFSIVVALLSSCCMLNCICGEAVIGQQITISKCPGLLVGVAYANQTASIMWTPPIASDGVSAIKNVKIVPSGISKPPHRFAIGQHLVQYIFTSDRGMVKRCSFSVLVLEKVKLIKKPPKQLFIRPGKTFLFLCQGTSSRKVRYVWTKNDVELKRTDRIQWSEEIPGLVVKDTVISDSGTYSCTAFGGSRKEPVEATTTNTLFTVNNKITWSPWEDWGPCDCRKRTRTRFRSCLTPQGDQAIGCEGQNIGVNNCAKACVDTALPKNSMTYSIKKGFQMQTQDKPRKVNKFIDTFYGRLALWSSIGVIGVSFCCVGFIALGMIHEKKQKKKEKRTKKNLADLEKSIIHETSSMSDAEAIYDKEEEVNRKTYEKKRDTHDRKDKGQPEVREVATGSLLKSNNRSQKSTMEQPQTKGTSSSSSTPVNNSKDTPSTSGQDLDDGDLVMAAAVVTQVVKEAQIKNVQDWSGSKVN